MSGDGSVAATYCATLVDEWARRGCRHAIISPGSRSTPMSLALDSDDRIDVAVHHDERAAAFMALGLGRATRSPAVVVTTSGTAAVELHPAVVEAHHACVPLLAVTADRPPGLVGTGAPQTIDQRNLFGTAVRWYCEPGVPDARGSATWRDLACDAYDRTLGLPPGPVHLNLAFDEPLTGVPGPLPPAVDRPRPLDAEPALTDEMLARLTDTVSSPRGIIVAGDRAARHGDEAEAILRFATQRGWPVLADHLSGLRLDPPLVVATFDPILRHSEVAQALEPDVVIRLGGLFASRIANDWIDRSAAVVIGIDRWGRTPDPSRRSAQAITAVPATVLSQLGARGDAAVSGAWAERWAAAATVARTAIAAELEGEPATIAAAVAAAPSGSAVIVASSMPIRDLESFVPGRADATFHANRGANGIDGVVSTAVGLSLAGAPTLAVVGDVAFLHDSTALIGLGRRGVHLAVVVLDNDGGGIFSFLDQADRLAPDRFERLFGTPHGVDLAVLARAHGLDVVEAADPAEVATAITEWSRDGGVRVVIVRSDRTGNRSSHRRLEESVGRALAALGAIS